MNPEIFENNRDRENRYSDDQPYKNLKNVCNECPADLNRTLRDLHTLTTHLEEEKVLYLTDLMTEFLLFEKDLPKGLTSKILYTTTCGFIHSLNKKVNVKNSALKTQTLIQYKYHTILENLDEIQKFSEGEDADFCEFGKETLSTINEMNHDIPKPARFLDENLL